MADYATSLERTRNLLANHRIPIQRSTDLSALSIASRKLARSLELTQNEEHTAQLFFAQRGYDLSRHLHSVMTTQVEPRAHRTIPAIDFDIDEHVAAQQEVVAANLLQSSLAYHHLNTTEVFSHALCNDWANSKQSILNSISYNIGLPTPADPANESWAAANQFTNPLSLPESLGAQFTLTQDLYGQAICAFNRRMHDAHLQSDLISLRETILELPQHLNALSRQLEQAELNEPMSSSAGVDSSGNPIPPHPSAATIAQSSLALLRQHEQASEMWMWFDCLAQVHIVEHTREAQGSAGGASNVLVPNADLSSSRSDLGGLAPNMAPAQKLSYRFKNWFLPTTSNHGVVATIEYLQQCFIEHLSNTIGQDQNLSAQYNECIESIQDDDCLMVEMVLLFARSRDFTNRFFANSSGGSDAYDNQIVTLGTTAPDSLGAQAHPNIAVTANNPWVVVYACIRAGYYSAALKFLTDPAYLDEIGVNMNTTVLVQVLELYAKQQEESPVSELQLPPDLWCKLFSEMATPLPTGHGSGSSTAAGAGAPVFQDTATSNPFRKVVYSVLGHFPVVTTEMKRVITPFVLTTIEDFLWYRLRLVTQQQLPAPLLDSYRMLARTSVSASGASSTSPHGLHAAGTESNATLLDQLSLYNLQTSVLTRGKSYFAGVGTGNNTTGTNGGTGVNGGGSLLFVHILFMTQQFERAVVEFFSINPVLAFHLALTCLVFGLIRTTDLHSDLCIPIHLGVKAMQSLQTLQASSSAMTSAALTSRNRLGHTVMNHTLHTRFAINMFKVISDYTQLIQAHRSDVALSYAYYTRFIPLFGNISLYRHYIQNNHSQAAQQQLDTTLNLTAAGSSVQSGQHGLLSLEYTIDMVLNASIPKNLLHTYQTTVLNLNAPVSNLILTHDKVTMTPLQFQQLYLHAQEKLQGSGPSANQSFLASPLDQNDTQFSLDHDQSVLNATLSGGNVNLASMGLSQFSGVQTAIARGLYTQISNACGVELPLIVDLLLLNKLNAGSLLGPGRTMFSVARSAGAALDPTGQDNGALGWFYPFQVITAITQLAVARDSQQ